MGSVAGLLSTEQMMLMKQKQAEQMMKEQEKKMNQMIMTVKDLTNGL